MILPLPGIYVKEKTSIGSVLYTALEYNCEEVGRLYQRGQHGELFIMKNGKAIDKITVLSLKSAVLKVREFLGLKDGRSCRR